MPIKLEQIHVDEVRFGESTELIGGTLEIRADDLREALVGDDSRIRGVEIETVRPGDSARVVCVKDVIEPRCNVDGGGCGGGAGRVRVLKNVAVATCGPIVGFQEGIIDMSGPGADHTPFSQFPLVVLCIEPVSGLAPHGHEEAVRLAGLRAAEALAEAAHATT